MCVGLGRVECCWFEALSTAAAKSKSTTINKFRLSGSFKAFIELFLLLAAFNVSRVFYQQTRERWRAKQQSSLRPVIELKMLKRKPLLRPSTRNILGRDN